MKIRSKYWGKKTSMALFVWDSLLWRIIRRLCVSMIFISCLEFLSFFINQVIQDASVLTLGKESYLTSVKGKLREPSHLSMCRPLRERSDRCTGCGDRLPCSAWCWRRARTWARLHCSTMWGDWRERRRDDLFSTAQCHRSYKKTVPHTMHTCTCCFIHESSDKKAAVLQRRKLTLPLGLRISSRYLLICNMTTVILPHPTACKEHKKTSKLVKLLVAACLLECCDRQV